MPDVGRFDGFAGVRRGFLTEIQLTKVQAGRKAFLWEHETYDLLAAGKPLTGLEGIGPVLARRIQDGVYFRRRDRRICTAADC